MKILTKGCYSDYEVVGILSEETAKKIKALDGECDFEIEEIDEIVFEELDLSLSIQVQINVLTGEPKWEAARRYSICSPFYPDDRFGWRYNIWPNLPQVGHLQVHGVDHERVQKVYSERLAWLKASPVERTMDHGN